MKTKIAKQKTERIPQRRLKALKLIVQSKVIFIILLLILQLVLLAVVVFHFYKYSKYLGWFSFALSSLFLTYLMAKRGKNEFKIVWIVPVLFLPVFGISLYFLYKINGGRRKLKRNLKTVKDLAKPVLDEFGETEAIAEKYPKVGDITNYLKKTGNYPAYTSVTEKYFSCGEEFFADLKPRLQEAKKFIFIEYFIISPSQTWLEILDILKEKAKNGVEVRVLYDSIGSVMYSTKKYEKYLAKFGIKAKVFIPFAPFFDVEMNNRDHRKILVVDGETVYTGGLNISDEYANLTHPRFDYWKDIAIRLDGKAVESFTVMFLQLWNVANKCTENVEDYKKYTSEPLVSKNEIAAKNASEGKNGVFIPYGDDAFSGEDIAENVYLYILSKAHDYVHIMTPYTIIDNTMFNVMAFAAKRGVEVSVIVPHFYDHYITFCVGRTYIKSMIECGINVYEYNRGFVHAKSFVSDANRATVGSVNLDYRSLYHHFECGVFLYRTKEIHAIEKDFQETLKDCTKITMATYKKIPFHTRVIGWCFRLFAPLL